MLVFQLAISRQCSQEADVDFRPRVLRRIEDITTGIWSTVTAINRTNAMKLGPLDLGVTMRMKVTKNPVFRLLM